MAKVKFDYDAERKTFYFFEGEESHRIVNICVDEDITLLVDFDVLYPKHVTALGAPSQELALEFFSIALRDMNHARQNAKEAGAFRKFISGERISHCLT